MSASPLRDPAAPPLAIHVCIAVFAATLAACGGTADSTAEAERSADGRSAAEAASSASSARPEGVPARDPASFDGLEWTSLASDPEGDGARDTLPDGAAVSFRQESAGDTLWFRIDLHDLPDADVFGTNLVVDTDGDASNGAAWWGANEEFRYDRLVTAWVTRDGDRFRGTIGVGDAAGARERNFTNLHQDNLALGVDPEAETIFLGVAPEDLGSPERMEVVVAVGSNAGWNDDIPDSGTATVELGGT